MSLMTAIPVAEAKPGTNPISPRVPVAVEYAVKVEPVGEFELKGIRLGGIQCGSRGFAMHQRFAPSRDGAIVPIRREPSQTRSEFKRRSTAKMI